MIRTLALIWLALLSGLLQTTARAQAPVIVEMRLIFIQSRLTWMRGSINNPIHGLVVDTDTDTDTDMTTMDRGGRAGTI